MSDGYVVEIADEIVGIIVRQPGEVAFRFHSAARRFNGLEGHVFRSPQDAERAALKHMSKRSPSHLENNLAAGGVA